jgi:hypothetical protein
MEILHNAPGNCVMEQGQPEDGECMNGPRMWYWFKNHVTSNVP